MNRTPKFSFILINSQNITFFKTGTGKIPNTNTSKMGTNPLHDIRPNFYFIIPT